MTFDLGYIDTFSIGTNPGQGMMNKAAGEIGPTWWLGVNGYHDRKRIYDAKSRLKAEWNGEAVTEIESHMPLGWILKQPPAEWELGDKEYGVVEVMVRKSPPSWK